MTLVSATTKQKVYGFYHNSCIRQEAIILIFWGILPFRNERRFAICGIGNDGLVNMV